MMTKTQSSKFALAKYILFIPLAILMLIIFSCKEDIQNIAIKDATNDLQVSLLYTPDLEFFGEFNNAPENRTETSEKGNVLYAAENRTTASLEEFEQEMKIEYAKLTDSAEQEAFKQTFIEELGKRLNIENLLVAFTIPNEDISDKNTLYTIVDEMPRFPGCEHETNSDERKKCAEKQMLQHIYSNVVYPAEAKKTGKEGMVVVSFVVEADGQITNLEILRSVGYGTDEEVIRIVENMPNWTPGIHHGEAVRVKYNLPVRFKLEG